MRAARSSSPARTSVPPSTGLSRPSSRSRPAAGRWPKPPRRSRLRPPGRARSRPSWQARRGRSLVNRLPPVEAIPRRSARNLRVLKASAPQPLSPPTRPSRRVSWDSLFLRILFGSVLVNAPFFVGEALTNFATWLSLGTFAVLAAVLAFVTWWLTQPVAALTDVVDDFESGDTSARAIPAGGSDTRRLAANINTMFDRLGADLAQPAVGVRMVDGAARIAPSANPLPVAAVEQSAAGLQARAGLDVLESAPSSLAETVAAVVVHAGQLRTNIPRAQTDLQAPRPRTHA